MSKTEEWLQQYISNSNFTLEIWNSMLFVEAKRVVINGKTFDVGYPAIDQILIQLTRPIVHLGT